jgi:hypothetical protein
VASATQDKCLTRTTKTRGLQDNVTWRGSPNSIAALRRHQVPWPDQRKCRRCRGIAIRGQDHCTRHSGPRSQLTGAAGRAESRKLAALEHAGLLPFDLISLPLWRNLNGLPTSTRSPLRLALVQAWDARQVEPLRWAQVQRQALSLAAQPGKRQNTAFWYENR